MPNKFNLDDYNTVPERMAEFFAKYPEGSLSDSECQYMQVDGRWLVIVKSKAFRTPDDPKPGVGHAQEFIPGTTQFTKDSELQNAETASWGRAIMAVGAADSKKGIASREEVRNRTAPRLAAVPNDNAEGTQALLALAEDHGWTAKVVAEAFEQRMGKHPRMADNDDLFSFVTLVASGAVTIEA